MVNKRRSKTNNWFKEAYRDPLRYIFINKIRKNVPLLHRSIKIHNPNGQVIQKETPPPRYSTVVNRQSRQRRTVTKKKKKQLSIDSTDSSYDGHPLSYPNFSPIPKFSTPKGSASKLNFSLSNYSPSDRYGLGAISKGNTGSLINSFNSRAEHGAIPKRHPINIKSPTFQIRKSSRDKKPRVPYSP